MSYRVLARKYRPETFSDVVGQDPIIRTLTRSFSQDRLAHAYIFSGPRGIGKTTTARLLAKLVNCEDPRDSEPCNECESCREIQAGRSVDVIEIDGATNNSVDEVRELREQVQYTPASSRRKVYIIDEVHMLSRSAFNALLKTLEEPPDHVLFIFATTEVEQVPDTILSRCQRFDFRLISQHQIVETLQSIAQKEDISVSEGALYLIAKFAEGSLRDAQSILDMMVSYAADDETITEELVSETWGLASYDELLSMLEALQQARTDRLLNHLNDHLSRGNDLILLVEDLAEMMRGALLVKQQPGSGYLRENLPRHLIDELESFASDMTHTELSWLFDQLMDLHRNLRDHPRFRRELAEVELIRMARGKPRYNLAEILDRLEQLESGESDRPMEAPEPTPTERESSRRTETDDTGGSDRSDVASTPEPPEPETAESSAPTRDDPAPSVPDSGSVVEAWDRILQAVPNPAQAYLRNADAVRRDGDTLRVVFEQQWANHVEQLQQPEHRQKLQDAIEEVVGQRWDVRITVRGTEPEPEADVSGSTPEPGTDEESTEEDPGQRLLEQTMRIFDVEEVQRIETD